MILVVGKAGAGKHAWVQQHFGFGKAECTQDPYADASVLSGLQDVMRNPETAIDSHMLAHFDVVVCDEVGLGLVPIDADERAWRERVGRLCIQLAAQATQVVRVVDGAGIYIKDTAEPLKLIIELYRHGATAGNARSAYIGITDEPLSQQGREALGVVDSGETQVFVSSRIRTKETAAILFPQAEQVEVPELSEMNFGVFEGRNFQDLEHDSQYRAWVDALCETPCPQGEATADFKSRCVDAFRRIVDEAMAELVIDETASADNAALAAEAALADEPALANKVALTDEAMLVGEIAQRNQESANGDCCVNAVSPSHQAKHKRLRFVVHGGTIMAVMEQFAVPHKSYFEWRTPHGACWVLKTTPAMWANQNMQIVKDPNDAGDSAC